MQTSAMNIRHDTQRGCFCTEVDGLECMADYQLDGNRMTFTHTGVPSQLEGRGIAAALVRHALEWAKAQGLQVVPACSYVQAYLRRHPEYQALTAEGRAR